MKVIYIVVGCTGEYSDRKEWNVAAYDNEIDAKQHVELASQEALIIFEKNKDNYEFNITANKYDIHMDMDYTGTSYYISECTIYEDIIQYCLTN